MRAYAGRLVPSVLVSMLSIGAANAEYPERPLRWIIPAAAGGGADASARIIAPELATLLGQQVVIDNRPGASGTIGINTVAKASADGYTMGAGNISNIATNRAVKRQLPYNPDTDLRGVVQTHFQPNVLVVSPAVQAKSVADVIALAKKSPDHLIYASSGVGSSLHFAGELFRLLSNAPLRHVPYNSVPVAIADVIGGRIHIIFDNLSSAIVHLKAGRVRGLATTGPARSPILPDLPTIAESGVPGYELTVWSGVIVPAGVPRIVVERLNAAVNKCLEQPAVRARLSGELGLQLVGGSADNFERLIRSELRKWKDVAAKAGIQPE
ncbi:MAG: tripartite tricarboxylate transporter substrate binding protein [Burkholderiales bacterium]|nr:tripartite tricarboxylate transporter substrate binding protein [Burkholderiales bacterium]